MTNYQNLSFEDVIHYLQISKNTLNLLIKKNHIPYQIDLKGNYKFKKEQLRSWHSQRMIEGSQQQREDVINEARQVSPKMKEISLTSFITEKTILMNMHCSSVKSSLRILAKSAYDAGFVDDSSTLFDELLEREEHCSTSLGAGIALPHTSKHDQYLVLEPFIMIGFAGGIPFQASDGKLVDLIIFPAMNDDNLHLYIIAKISSLFYATNLAQDLREAKNEQEVIELVKFYEDELVKKSLRGK